MKFVELVTFVTVELDTFAKVGCVEFVVDRMEELMIVMSVPYNLEKEAFVKVELVISIEKFAKKEIAT